MVPEAVLVAVEDEFSPHYVQAGGAPVIAGSGPGVFSCPCGRSTLIAGYEPRECLGLSIQCAACGEVVETPGLAPGVPPPASVTLIERGASDPPAVVPPGTALIGRQERDRLAAMFLPRATGGEVQTLSPALLDDVEETLHRWTGAHLDPTAASYKSAPLAWAVAHCRARLAAPDWAGFVDDADLVAMTVIAGFREFFTCWSRHPLFRGMLGTVEAQGFSLHGMGMFGAAKYLFHDGNQVAFDLMPDAPPRIAGIKVILPGHEAMSVAVERFDRFEWPNGAEWTPRSLLVSVIDAMAAVQGRINRLRPGILVLSPGAVGGGFDRALIDAMATAVRSHGKRHRGLSAVAAILPKVQVAGAPGAAMFGYHFYPVPNRHHAVGEQVRIGSRGNHAEFV